MDLISTKPKGTCPLCGTMEASEEFYGELCCPVCKGQLVINESISRGYKEIEDAIKLGKKNIEGYVNPFRN